MEGRGSKALDLRDVFAEPWEGEGTIALPVWLRWFPAPRTFRFRSEIADVAGDRWTVVDTTTMRNGDVQERRMSAHQVAPDTVRVSADDMPGGADIALRPDGFSFSPYTIRTPVLGPIRVSLRYTDEVDIDPGGTSLVDRIEMRLAGILVARLTMRLQRLPTRGHVAGA